MSGPDPWQPVSCYSGALNDEIVEERSQQNAIVDVVGIGGFVPVAVVELREID
jgi:hypothetical protein